MTPPEDAPTIPRPRWVCGDRGGRLPSGAPCPATHGLHHETGLCWRHRPDWAVVQQIDPKALLARLRTGETTVKAEALQLGVGKKLLERFLIDRAGGRVKFHAVRDMGWRAVQQRRKQAKAQARQASAASASPATER
jgi:hypothetical protein